MAYTDGDRFAFLEQQAKKSQTGITFDYVPSIDGKPSGWRFMRRHWISEPHKRLRHAVDTAMQAADPKPAF